MGPCHFFSAYCDISNGSSVCLKSPHPMVLTTNTPSLSLPHQGVPKGQGQGPLSKTLCVCTDPPLIPCHSCSSHILKPWGLCHYPTLSIVGSFFLLPPCYLDSSSKTQVSSRGSHTCRQSPEPSALRGPCLPSSVPQHPRLVSFLLSFSLASA